MNLAWPELQRNLVKRYYTWKHLLDIAGFQHVLVTDSQPYPMTCKTPGEEFPPGKDSLFFEL